MATIRIEIEKGEDLSVLESLLTDLGLKYSLENDGSTYEDLPAHAIAGIQAGLKDVEEGRVYSSQQAKERLERKISEMRVKYAN